MQSIEGMIALLVSHPEVLGLMEYGSARHDDESIHGDYDLFVVVKHRHPQVESLHFYVDGVPVDLNLRTLDEIRDLALATGFEQTLLDARIIHDPTGRVAREIRALRSRQEQAPHQTASEETIAFIRHGTKHIFDKVRSRLDSMPIFSAYMLQQSVYWLVREYFVVRDMPFKGEKNALEYLERNDPRMFDLIEQFYATTNLPNQLSFARRVSDMALAPVGGPWRNDEVLVFGDQAKGREVFADLFERSE